MRIGKDGLSGLLFIVLGGGGALIAGQYNLGTLSRMGPGFFPVMLGSGIAGLGLVIILRELLAKGHAQLPQFDFRPLFFISVALAVFALLIREVGLVASLLALITIARFAGKDRSLIELGLMAAVLTAVAVAIFVYALNIPLRLWP